MQMVKVVEKLVKNMLRQREISAKNLKKQNAKNRLVQFS